LSEDLRDCKLLNGIIYFITLDIKMLSDISKVLSTYSAKAAFNTLINVYNTV